MMRKRLDSIDLLKGIAILMVIVVHTSQKYKLPAPIEQLCDFGQFGCQLFFVISGYMAYLSYSSCENPRVFYQKRFLAIAPGWHLTMILFILVNFVWNLLGFSPIYKECRSVAGILINALFLNGLVSFCNNNGIPGGWFVGTIAIFYLLCPFLIQQLNRVKNMGMVWFCPLVMLLINMGIQCFIGVLTGTFELSRNNEFLYFSIINQLPCIMCGLIVGKVNIRALGGRIIQIVLGGGTCLALAYALSYCDSELIYMIMPCLLGYAFSMILVGLLWLEDAGKKLFFRPFNKFGTVSYYAYLIHTLYAYYITTVINKVLRRVGMTNGFVAFVPVVVLTVFLTFFTAVIYKKIVEIIQNKLYYPLSKIGNSLK